VAIPCGWCGTPSGTIARIESPRGRWIALTYNVSQPIAPASDSICGTVIYTYASSRLWKSPRQPAGSSRKAAQNRQSMCRMFA